MRKEIYQPIYQASADNHFCCSGNQGENKIPGEEKEHPDRQNH